MLSDSAIFMSDSLKRVTDLLFEDYSLTNNLSNWLHGYYQKQLLAMHLIVIITTSSFMHSEFKEFD